MKKNVLYIAIIFICISLIGCNKSNTSHTKSLDKDEDISTTSKPEEVPNTNTQGKELTGNENLPTADAMIEEVDYSDCFDGIKGCAVFWDSTDKLYSMYDKTSCEERSSPCSSFKIISTLMGLDSGVIESADSTMNYNGTVYPNVEWNSNLNLKDAFQKSCIWYFRKVIDSIGKADVQKYLSHLEYGNADISEWNGSGINQLAGKKPAKDLNGFWLESSLQISPREQVEVLEKIFDGKSEFSKKNINILKEIMLVQKNKEVTIFGKTGTGKNTSTGNSDNAWFVGMFETQDQRDYFAVRLKDESRKDINGLKAKEIALAIINKYYLDKKKIYKKDYSIKIPRSWSLKNVNDYETDCYMEEKKIAVITELKDCNYSSNTSSIITNLLGMHAVIAGDTVEIQRQGYKLTKVNITYEQSAAEKIKKESSPSDELHYFYTNNKNIIIDFVVYDTELINNTDEIAESLIIN